MMKKILLDKSFLQSAPTKLFLELAETHTLLMPDVLFYEMISCDEPARSRCFAKLPPGENPVVLLKNLGALLKKEMKTHQPCGLPSENVHEIRYSFDPALRSKSYEIPEDVARRIAAEAEVLKLEVAQYLKRAAVVRNMFDKSEILRMEARNDVCDDAMKEIANFEQFRALYNSMVSHSPSEQYNPPPANLVGPDWACARLMQVQLIFGVDIWYRYGGNFPNEPTGRAYVNLEHDVLDANYLIMGVLQGSLATLEKKLRRWFRLLRPDGDLYPDDGGSMAG